MFQKHIIEWVPIDVGDIKANNLDSVIEGEVGLIINTCHVQDAIISLKNYFVGSENPNNLIVNLIPEYKVDGKVRLACCIADPDSIIEADLIIGPGGYVLNQEIEESVENHFARLKFPPNIRNSYKIVPRPPNQKKKKQNKTPFQAVKAIDYSIKKPKELANQVITVPDEDDDDVFEDSRPKKKRNLGKKKKSFGTPPGGDKYTNFIDTNRYPWIKVGAISSPPSKKDDPIPRNIIKLPKRTSVRGVKRKLVIHHSFLFQLFGPYFIFCVLCVAVFLVVLFKKKGLLN